MPTMRKVAPEEAVKFEKETDKGMRAAIARQYDEYLSDFTPGDWGKAELGENESKVTVRNRLKAAAGRRMWALEFKRTRDNSVIFRVIGQSTNVTSFEEALEMVA